MSERSVRAKTELWATGRVQDVRRETFFRACLPHLLHSREVSARHPRPPLTSGPHQVSLGKLAEADGRHPGQLLRWGQHWRGRWFLAPAR